MRSSGSISVRPLASFRSTVLLFFVLDIVPTAAAVTPPELFDVVVSLHNDPMGDDDGGTQGVDPASAEQDVYERILQHFADAVFESTEGAHKIRTVRIFRNRNKHDTADVIWEAAGHPMARLNGVTSSGFHIYMFDIFSGGAGGDTDLDLLADEIGAGYTLGHEWGHYAYGLKDEYVKRVGDVAVDPSIMNSQWNAISSGMLIDSRWLNFSIAFQGDPPGDFQNTKRTDQHRKYGEGGWETLARSNTLFERLVAFLRGDPLRVVYPELGGVAPSGSAVPSFPDLPGSATSDLEIIWMKTELTFEIVIDKSGSMFGTKIENAKTAAKLLVDLAQESSTSIGVIAFSSSPSVVVPITDIVDQGSKDAVKAMIDRITAGGGTAIGAAAQAALNELTTAAGADVSRIVFLLSDGISGDDALAPIAAYIANQIPIFTFGYGSNADTSTLGEIATATGGKLFTSPTTLAEVSQAFQDANAVATSSTNVATGSGTVDAAGTATTIQVDSTMARLAVTVVHSDAPAAALFELVAPDGMRVPASTIEESGGETLVFFSVDNPTPGSWILEGMAATGSLDFEFQASGVPTDATFTLTADSVLGPSLEYPDPLILIASLGMELPVAGANLAADVIAPDDTQTLFSLVDDGVPPDGTAGDGIYTAALSYDQSGVYKIVIRCQAEAGTAVLTSNGIELSAGIDGSLVPPPPDLPLAEDFQRFERFEVTTHGVVVDDHGNTPFEATPIDATNQELVSGRIEIAGDVDVFAFEVPPVADEVAVRVSGLALGMDPMLRIFNSDGMTVLAEGTLATTSGQGGYLALRVTAPAGTTLFPEVSHTQAAGTGFYQVSAGPVLDLDMEAVVPVDIDIRPGSFPNSVNPRSTGVISVAVLGTPDFDATTIDPISVAFGPTGAHEAHGMAHIEDADRDGLLDMVLHFRTQESGIQCGDTETSLTGQTVDGVPIEGSDSIRTVGCK